MMYFTEYIDKEIPKWKTNLKIEYVEKVKQASMDLYNREMELEALKNLYAAKPSDYYKKMIEARERSIEKYKINLKNVTEDAKKHLEDNKTIYDYALEALNRIKEYRKKYDEISEITEKEFNQMKAELENSSNEMEEHRKKL